MIHISRLHHTSLPQSSSSDLLSTCPTASSILGWKLITSPQVFLSFVFPLFLSRTELTDRRPARVLEVFGDVNFGKVQQIKQLLAFRHTMILILDLVSTCLVVSSILGRKPISSHPHHKWRSDGTIWTNGTTRHSSNQKKTIRWSHSATPDNQTSQSALRMDTRRWQEEGRKTKEDMARHQEKEDLDTQGVDWSDARDTADDRARWRQLVAQCSAQNGRN